MAQTLTFYRHRFTTNTKPEEDPLFWGPRASSKALLRSYRCVTVCAGLPGHRR